MLQLATRSHPFSRTAAAVLVCAATMIACSGGGGGGDAARPSPPPAAEELASKIHGVACEALFESAIEGGEGPAVPGVAGAERWGMPAAPPAELRVRRSWSSLDAAEKKQVVDAFVGLKNAIAGSGEPGAERAEYDSFCGDEGRNLYDFYVELHASAFASMSTTDMAHTQMAHMGPQFLPWHRYLLLRIEADLREVSGDPSFALPYWDWEDCAEGEGCGRIFEPDYLGSGGSCDQNDDVAGYLVDQGFVVNLWAESNPQTGFSARSINCGTKSFQRNVGCSRQINGGRPASAEDVEAIYERRLYDAEPYDSCNTDAGVSMRQYVEGYTNRDVNPICVFAGCQMHGLGHLYVGGDMAANTAPNDPIFFLHHANVDRLWAMWQERNLGSSETAADHGNPGFPDDWRGELFNFEQVRADETFDFRALGYRYDTNQAG